MQAAWLLISMLSSDAQTAANIQCRASANEVRNSLWSRPALYVANGEKGEGESHFYTANALYPLGFGPGPSFAYLKRVSGEGATCDHWVYTVQEMSTGRLLDQWSSRGLGSGCEWEGLDDEGDEPTGEFLTQVAATGGHCLLERLRKLEVDLQQAPLAKAFPLRYEGDVFRVEVEHGEPACDERKLPERPVFIL
ncbi:MAG: hypothetical protein AAF658_12690, partial [Myxococcota bacterium]